MYSRRGRTGEEEPEVCSRIGFRADRSAAVATSAYGNKKGRRVFPKAAFYHRQTDDNNDTRVGTRRIEQSTDRLSPDRGHYSSFGTAA